MKKLSAISLASAALCSPFLSSYANAEEYNKGFYASIGIGSGTYSDLILAGTVFSLPFEAGFSYDGSFGYDFGKRFRVDLSYANTTSTVSTGNEAVFGSVIFNGYIDFPIKDSKWEPFVGLGYGSTNVDATNLCTVGGADVCEDDVATFSVSGGVNYSLSPNLDLTGKVTYLGFDTIYVRDNNVLVTVTESETVAAHVGLKFKF